MTTNKRHSRGGLKPSPKNKRNKAGRLLTRERAANETHRDILELAGRPFSDDEIGQSAAVVDESKQRRVAHCERVDAWKRQHRQRHAENLAAAALARYKAVAEDQAAWHDRRGQIIARDPGVSPPFVVADRLDERPWARLTTAPAQAKREGRPLVRRLTFNTVALCIALIGGDK
jgi:hypothetical protein